MKCNTDDNEKDNLGLYARLSSKHVVGVYDKQTNNVTLSNEYSKRVKISGPLQKVTMTISDLQLKDSGLYIGLYKKYDVEKNEEVEEEGCCILLFVNGKHASIFRLYILGNIDADSTLLCYWLLWY